jgi:hypothetical protein
MIHKIEWTPDPPTTEDLIRIILQHHEKHQGDYDKISRMYFQGSVPATCEFLYHWCKDQLQYKPESAYEQTVRSPAAILENRAVDSKHYAMFIAGVLHSLQRNGHPEIKSIRYRFVAEKKQMELHHVFIVVNRRYHIDPLLQYNERRTWAKEQDYLV